MRRFCSVALGLALALGVGKAEGQSLPQGAAILKAAYAQSAGSKYYARDFLPLEMAPYDPDRALALGRRADGTIPDSVTAGVISVLAQADPARAAQWAPGVLERIHDPARKRDAETGLALAVAHVRPYVAASLYQRVKAGFSPDAALSGAGADWGRYGAYLQYVDLAAMEKDPDAEALLDRGVAQIKKSFPDKPDGGGVNDILTAAAEGVAPASPVLAEKVILAMPAEARAPAYARTISAMAASDPVAAQKLLAKMEQDAPKDSYFGQAALALIPVLGKTDPTASLALARRVGQDWENHKPYALATAAAFQSPDVAAKLYQEAVDAVDVSDRHAGSVLGWVAASAYRAVPALGARLFAEDRRRLAAAPAQNGMADFAFFYAQVAPDDSAQLIERAYTAPVPKGDSGWGPFHAALAMAAVNPNRAINMADAIPDINFRFDAQRKVAQYVLAPPAVRRALRFDRWSATDTWLPGTPTGW